MTIVYIVLAINCWYLNFVIIGSLDKGGVESLASAILSVILLPITPALLILYIIKSFSK